MRVGVIRGDMPGPVFLADLETVSERNVPTEPLGQARYLSRPTPTSVEAALAASVAPAIVGTAITFPLTINGSNNVLRVRLATSGSFTVVTVASAAYASIALLVAAVNAALNTAGVGATSFAGSVTNTLRLVSNTKGAGSTLAIDTVGSGSTFNGAANWGSGATTVTLPSGATIITATLPVGGPLDVSTGTVTGISGLTNASVAEIKAIADAVAPQFVETDVLKKSVQSGSVHGLLSGSYSPDPTRVPALSLGAAVVVVQDDGTSTFTAPVPHISGAVHDSPSTGDITITGTGLGNSEYINASLVRVMGASGAVVRLYQKTIAATLTGGTQGVVSGTSIVIPASLLNGLGIVGTTLFVQFTSLASNTFTVT